jgi:multicomponent Na+:H+ antiporter subunit C
MDPALLYSLAGIWVTVIGLRGVLVEADILRRILAAGVMGTGIFLFLVAMARRTPTGPPDPVPHGMVLTGIVVSVSAIGLLLALLGRLHSLEDEAP